MKAVVFGKHIIFVHVLVFFVIVLSHVCIECSLLGQVIVIGGEALFH